MAGGGYVCSGRTMAVGETPPEIGFTPSPPDVEAPTPYEYGVNHADDVPLYRRLPTKGEIRAEEERRQRLLAAAAAAAAPPPDGGPAEAEATAEAAAEETAEAEDEEEEEEEEEPTGPIVTRLSRGFYVTIDAIVSHEGRQWVRTAALNYIASSGVSRRRVPDIHGAELGESLTLPIAMVYMDGARTVRPGRGGRYDTARELERFDLVPVAGTATIRGAPHYATGQGDFIPAERVRLIEAADPPPGIGADERWIDVDLGRQTLVAYEGARPVYATLVATGKPGFETPPGEYRLLSKYISTNMADAPDGDDPYLIEDVPWTMYFQGAFALHGAFWHSRFGQVRSHGCVNLAPADARWLFFWVGPRLPEGWHGVTATEDNPGSRVFIHE